ncbi:MAG: putative Mg2+ transporter-C (MgtC) family protein [Actinomycetota bacterium]|nr:putative Mg2+ transporter-C (MgtC) family protein [Actinomycetota bacterium]
MAHLSNWDIIGRLLLAAVVGGAIGFERETAGQDAGLRTHLMLALGAAIFGEISVGAWDHFQTPTANSIFRADVTRVASYVAAGIGFVGGGAIVKSAGQVRGLTTAASLWVAGAAGLGAGVGFWLPAVAGTVIGYLSLATRRPMRRLIRYVGTRRIGAATIVLDDDADPGRVVDALRALPNPPTKIRLGAGEDDDNVEIEAEFGLRHADEVAEYLQTIGARPDVKAVNVR